MSKKYILSCLCLVILFINYVDAQNRPSRSGKPARRPFKAPPARVLNNVDPQRRTRQQQMQIKLRQMSKTPPTHGKIKPAVVRSYQDDRCFDNPDGLFPHDECDMYYYCDENGFLEEWYCEPEAPIFDYYYLTCMTEEEGGQCLSWVDDGNWADECPTDPYDVTFFAGETCNDYYICLSGWPTLLNCAPGQHWNQALEYCDTPINAQCDPSIAPSPPSLPDCQNTVGTVPHPFDCRQFIFCQKNGSRMVQSCPHLLAYDINLNKCVIEHQAKCGTAYSQNKLRRN